MGFDTEKFYLWLIENKWIPKDMSLDEFILVNNDTTIKMFIEARHHYTDRGFTIKEGAQVLSTTRAKLTIATEALERYADPNEYDRRECEKLYIAREALAKIKEQ